MFPLSTVCATVLIPRGRFIFLTTRRASSSDLFPGFQVASGAQKAHWGTQRAAATITAAAGSGLWVGLWARAGSGNHPGHLILL